MLNQATHSVFGEPEFLSKEHHNESKQVLSYSFSWLKYIQQEYLTTKHPNDYQYALAHTSSNIFLKYQSGYHFYLSLHFQAFSVISFCKYLIATVNIFVTKITRTIYGSIYNIEEVQELVHSF